MKSNHKHSHKAAIVTGLLLALPLSLYAPQSYAEISDTPLYVAQSVPPNIMFTIDDSGSMQFEVMPATKISDQVNINYMYPDMPSATYDSSGYGGSIPTFEYDAVNAYLRSSFNNKIYYNPEVTYLPWSKKRGELWDDADPAAAYWNPANTFIDDGNGNNIAAYDLTIQHKVDTNWAFHGDDDATIDPIDVDCDKTGNDNSCVSYTQSFWPMVYWIYKGTGSVYEPSSYDKVEIRYSATTPTLYINDVVATMANLDALVTANLSADTARDTVEEEAQNFANWFQYYRSRALLAKAGIGRAFSKQGDNMRVGFATINSLSDGKGVTLGVRKFTDTYTDTSPKDNTDDTTADDYRTKFFDTLYNLKIPTQGTPLRLAMAEVGEYFMDSSNDGPWSATPGTVDNQPQLACRQTYHVFMTDGYWNGQDPDKTDVTIDGTVIGNEDGTDGPTISGPDGQSFTYKPKPPYEDTYNETLADVAMYLWQTDLRPKLKNRVPTSPLDPAFWQHIVTFTVGLGVFGKYTKDDLDELRAGTKKWPDPTDTEDSDRIDDLFHAGVNGHGEFFSAADPTEFAKALSNTLSDIASRVSSAAAVATNSTRLDAGAQIYQARYNSGDWSGQLISFNLISSGANAGEVGTVAWEAGKKLNAEVAGNITATRNIVTFRPDTGTTVDFLYTNLSTAQKALLDQNAAETTDGKGKERVQWLRGSHDYEVGSGTTGASFRARANVLGDIVNSNPHFMGHFDYRYFSLPGDTGNEGLSYATFRDSAAYKNRPNVLFIGANDGMLHAFNAEDGTEIFAYVPNALYDKLPELTDPDYEHQFYVDGSPRSGDAYFNSSWHTVLVGGLGAGGQAIYALDVTTPNDPKVLWEFTTADTVEDPKDASDLEDLGYTFSEPTIVRLYDGKWYVVFGNGYGSASGDAVLYLVDIATGTVTYEFEVDAGPDNGLSTPIPIDINGDRITDYIYAGDQKGNMWRFDVHYTLKGKTLDTSAWGGTKLFQAVDQENPAQPQPITHRPEVGLNPNGGVMVYFGTGQYYETGDNEVGTDPQIQTFYGIQDTLTSNTEVTRKNLEEQEILFEGIVGDTNIRILSSNDVDYGTQDGWFLELIPPNATVGKGERVVSRPLLRDGRIIFTTLIPSSDACLFGGTSWIMEMDPINGGSLSYTVFDIDGDGDFDADDFSQFDIDGNGTLDNVPVSGVQSTVGIVNTPGIISAGNTEYKYLSGSSGEIERVAEKSEADPARTSWRELLER